MESNNITYGSGRSVPVVASTPAVAQAMAGTVNVVINDPKVKVEAYSSLISKLQSSGNTSIDVGSVPSTHCEYLQYLSEHTSGSEITPVLRGLSLRETTPASKKGKLEKALQEIDRQL